MKTDSYQNLLADIAHMEIQQTKDWNSVQETLHASFENLKPIHWIKNTITELTASPEISENLLDTGISMTAGYISKEILVGNSGNPFKKLLGAVLQVAVTNLIAKNTTEIKSATMFLIHKLLPSNTPKAVDSHQ